MLRNIFDSAAPEPSEAMLFCLSRGSGTGKICAAPHGTCSKIAGQARHTGKSLEPWPSSYYCPALALRFAPPTQFHFLGGCIKFISTGTLRHMYPRLLNCMQRYKTLVCARGQRYTQPGPSSRERPVDSLLSGLGLLV